MVLRVLKQQTRSALRSRVNSQVLCALLSELTLGEKMEGVIYHGCVEVRHGFEKNVPILSSQMSIEQEAQKFRSKKSIRKNKSAPRTLPVAMDIDVEANAKPWALALSQIQTTAVPRWCQPRRVNNRRRAQVNANCLWR